jgi:hypothetical protein
VSHPNWFHSLCREAELHLHPGVPALLSSSLSQSAQAYSRGVSSSSSVVSRDMAHYSTVMGGTSFQSLTSGHPNAHGNAPGQPWQVKSRGRPSRAHAVVERGADHLRDDGGWVYSRFGS